MAGLVLFGVVWIGLGFCLHASCFLVVSVRGQRDGINLGLCRWMAFALVFLLVGLGWFGYTLGQMPPFVCVLLG